MLAESKGSDARLGLNRSRWARSARTLLLLLLVGALFVDPRTAALDWPPRVAAHHQPFTIPVYDYTSRWGDRVETGVQRWNAALAYRGIQMVYVRQTAATCETLTQLVSGISVCDSANGHTGGWFADGEHQEIWAADGTIHVRGRVRFYEAAPEADFADMAVCHELGHTLQLPHVPDGSDSCMTMPPRLVAPSAWDAANALSFIPDDLSVTVFEDDDDREKEKAKRDKKKEKKDARKDRKKDVKKGKYPDDRNEKREEREDRKDEDDDGAERRRPLIRQQSRQAPVGSATAALRD